MLQQSFPFFKMHALFHSLRPLLVYNGHMDPNNYSALYVLKAWTLHIKFTIEENKFE